MNVGIFVRVSVIDKKNKESPEIHEARARMFASSKGWNVSRVYVLPGVSGKTTLNQLETQKMLRDIKAGIIEGIIFSKLARLARNTEELLFYSKYFQEHNASLISLSESIDTSTSSGRLFYTMISAMGQWERENNLERMLASIETRRSLGKFTGGTVSYGFKIVDAKVVINEDEAPVRRLMFDLFLEHQRMSTVARKLNEKGYRTRKNKPWSDTTVRRLLKNTDAKGIRRFNYKAPVTKDNPLGLKPQSEWEYLKCPKIIGEKKWESVNVVIREQEKGSINKQPLNKRIHLFTNIIKCQRGHKMSIQSKSERYTCKECKYGIGKDDLEDIFLTRLKQFLKSNDELNEYNKSNAIEIQIKEGEIEFAESKLNKAQMRLDKLVELNLSGEIPTIGFKKHYEPIFLKTEQLRLNVKDLRLELEALQNAKSSFNEIATKSLEFYNNWEDLDRAEKRSIIESITTEIIFNNKTIKFKMKKIAPLSSLELGKNGQHYGTILLHGEKLQKL
ncbi:recombinase family protein [uncultured Psychroserpens sp.]|uniref:recombinase family protein n=1 Tax=uncultured Psychroserpens sp. TaxID=255436 RepID=UPI00261B5001|nr:recombinase family protein [uncultured Psychroserpens sp.]